MKPEKDGINPAVTPSGTGCVECLASGRWWLHLRRCAECGHIGCCDSSPNQHASKHNAATGHPIITSFEPGERVVLRLSYRAILRRPEASRSSLPSVGSAGTRAGRSGACRLENAGSRIGGSFLLSDLGVARPPSDNSAGQKWRCRSFGLVDRRASLHPDHDPRPVGAIVVGTIIFGSFATGPTSHACRFMSASPRKRKAGRVALLQARSELASLPLARINTAVAAR